MENVAALDLKNIRKNFQGVAALRGVDLSIPPGEIHVLLGSSGSGKSTLIRIIVGLLAADSGYLALAGESRGGVGQWSRRIGYVPQEGGLFPHLTGFQNVSLVADLEGWEQPRRRARAEELCDLMALDPKLLDRFPRAMSGGQRQRMAMVRAAFLSPPLFLLDEPLGALDPLIRRDVQDDLKLVFRRLGTSVLIVTHDMEEARFFGDRLSLLKDGRILQTGSFEDFLHRPADPFVTKFVDSQRRWDS
jgi:osmoprotectant transport system ATP-binding protein